MNPACDVSGNSECLPRAPHMDHPENCKVDLAILGDKLQPGLFSWHIHTSLQKSCLGKISFPWRILETSSASVQTYSVCTTWAISAYKASLMHQNTLDLLYIFRWSVQGRHNESNIARSFKLLVGRKHNVSAWGFASGNPCPAVQDLCFLQVWSWNKILAWNTSWIVTSHTFSSLSKTLLFHGNSSLTVQIRQIMTHVSITTTFFFPCSWGLCLGMDPVLKCTQKTPATLESSWLLA